MAIAITSLTSNSSLTDASSYATASIAPSAEDFLLASVVNFRNAGAATTPTMTGLSLTWTQIATTITTDNKLRITMFRAYSATTPASGTLTFDFAGQVQDRCLWSICKATQASSPQIQSATNVVTASSITVTLLAFADAANNAAFGAFSHLATNNNVLNVGTGFTQIDLVTSTESNLGVPLLTEWKIGEDLSVDASGNVGVGRVGIAIEIDNYPVQFSGLKVESVNTTTADLEWIDNSAGAKAPIVTRSTDNIAFTTVANVSAGVTTYRNTGLLTKTLYYYKVGHT